MLRALPYLLIMMLVAIFITQIFAPMFKGTKLFPIFRKKTSSLIEEITELKTQISEAELAHERDLLKEKLKSFEEEVIKPAAEKELQ